MSSFLNYLKDYILATEIQKENELWDVQGILKDKSNQEFKFDLRPTKIVKDNLIGKEGKTSTKAEKMVFETEKQWIIVDMEELHNKLKKENTSIIYLENILSEFEWNIVINK